jgi:serine/threonine protein kinase
VERAIFFDRLRQSRLLSETELEQAVSRFADPASDRDIADALVEEGVLTPYQARQVCAGDTQPLTLGQYRLLDELGRGGMGRVYKALHTIMGRVVAIKVISPDLVRNPIAVEWFRREVRATTQFVHPNIVMAYDANEAEGLHFLVMEYVQGVTLDALVKQHGPLPIEHACALIRQAALGLQYAHEKGMVHRDIKPANLLIPIQESEQAADVLVKIVDFGLARLQGKAQSDTIALRAEADVLGTPDYISPEQSRDIHAADIRSDLYSLGCAFYFALAGRVPFPGENAMEKLVKHLMEEAEPLEKLRPDVSPAVAAIVRCLMAKKPSDRYQTPAELVRELDAWVTDRPQVVPVTKTACRPLWLPAPTHAPVNRDASSEQTAHTRVLENVELFGPSREVVLSGPSLLEPMCDDFAAEKRPKPTRDTLSLSNPEDTEVSTEVATALERSSHPAARVDSDSTLQEMPSSVGQASRLSEPKTGGTPVPPQRVDPDLLRLWRRWAALVETIIEGSGPARVNSDVYRTVHSVLLQVCRSAAETADTPERRAFYQELISIVQPWFGVQTFAHIDANMLRSLLQRCKQAELELNDGKVPWTIHQFIGLVLLLLGPIGLALWYWNSGRLWLPSLVRTFEWRSPMPSLRSVWSEIQTHPSLLMGGGLLFVIVFSLYLLTRTPRT